MRLFLPLIVCFLLGLSCEPSKPDYRELIQGDWECNYLNERGDTTVYDLSFKDSICYFDMWRSENNRYTITGNKIRITTDYYWTNRKKNQYLRIVDLKNGMLKLVSDSSWFNGDGIPETDTLIFKAIKTKRNHFKKASVSLAEVGGDMPYLLQVEILQNRTIKLKAKGDKIFKTGYCYLGKLKQSTYSLLLNEINGIDFHNWKEDYSGCCDCGNNYLLFHLDGKKYKVHVYCDWDKPQGMQKLVAFLNANIKHVNWRFEKSKDCSFDYSKEMNVFMYGNKNGSEQRILQFIPPVK